MLSGGDTGGKGDSLLPLLLLQKSQGNGDLDKNLVFALLLQNNKSDALEALLMMQALGEGHVELAAGERRREQQRLRELELQNRQLRDENELLKKSSSG